jgi:hypothetical protein
MIDDILGLVSLAIAILSYSVYIAHTVQGTTKPHAITWLVWSSLHGFVFIEQMAAGAGAGAWVTAAAALANFCIAVLALFKGERNITRLDWLCLALTAMLLASWSLITDPLIAVVLAVAIFLVGFIPTVRKSTRKAHEETATTYLLNGVKFMIALAALGTLSLTTVLYPLTLGIVNIGFAVYLVLARQRQKKKGAYRGTKRSRRR